MWLYAIRRLLLLPFTLFSIILVNFVIINMAPGDPTSYSGMSADASGSRRDDRSTAFSGDERYLHFREFYGLTLPILFNDWPWLSLDYAKESLLKISESEKDPFSKEINDLKVKFGDQSRFIMKNLLLIASDEDADPKVRALASNYFARGGSYPAAVGPRLTPVQKAWNKKISEDQLLLRSFIWKATDSPETIQEHLSEMRGWYEKNLSFYHFEPSFTQKIYLFFFETRLNTYLNRVIRLDFGTLRNDSNKTVMSEVTKRFKYSLTLALLPMVVTFVLCQFFGFLMALNQKRWPDHFFNLFFLFLYAIPVFVVAPFLIEKVALYHCFPFTETAIPINGFTSADRIYFQESSWGRLVDIFQHIALPILAVMYTSLSAESRLSRTAILEVMRQDYIRTARAKGVSRFAIMFKHIGKNAAITIVTSLVGSLGLILGGSLIVETLFDINGFGKFFYDAVINRDYNVIMFSALAGSFITLLGYLAADLTYMWLDPRITLD